MGNELDKILIKYDQPDFNERFIEIRQPFSRTHFMRVTNHFEYRLTNKDEQLVANIIEDVIRLGMMKR